MQADVSSLQFSDRLYARSLFGRIGRFAALMLLGAGCVQPGTAENRLERYLYKDTRQLVDLVEDAADLMAGQGTAVFREFQQPGSRWLNDNYYLFVYDRAGICVFHPITPGLVGRNLIGMKDMNGKPVIRFITDVANKPEPDASGWVFYLWEEKTQLIPLWKSSYIRKVVTQDGNIYLLGCGVYQIKIEREFIRERVTQAADLLQTAGKETAFDAFRSAASPFNFLGTYIFVMDTSGHSLVDPSFPNMSGRSLLNFRDAVGFYAVREMIDKLQRQNEAWVQYMWPKPDEFLPHRKLAYVRKVTVSNETFIVGSDFFTATPVWMDN